MICFIRKRIEIRVATPVFGYKNHITTDRRHGVIRKWAATDAARHDGRELPRLRGRANTGSAVWADTAYRSRRDGAHMAKRGLRSQVHFRKPLGKPLPAPRARANATRSAIEHVFAHQMGPMALFVRTIGIARATTKIGMANLVYNMRRLVWWQGRAATA